MTAEPTAETTERNNMEEPTALELPLHACDQCERTFSSPFGLRMHKVRAHSGRNWDTSRNFRKGKRGRPWVPGQLEKFQKTMKAKAKRKLQYVFPLPEDADEPAADSPVAVVTCYCPKCGENLSKWKREE